MKKTTLNRLPRSEEGSTLLVAVSTVLILSIAGAGVLMNCTTRLNTTANQVKGWKEALTAAEAGADLAFAEVRKNGLVDPDNPPSDPGFLSTSGWLAPAPLPNPQTNSWALGSSTPFAFGSAGNLSTTVTVDKFASLPGSTTGVGYYRIRSVGIAQVSGLKRTGMDNRLDAVTKGDNLLRKIDMGVDHFISTFGYGDALASAAPTGANGKRQVAVMSADKAQVSRRIELIAIPVMLIEGAVKTAGSFRGTTVDSYDSKSGVYKGANPSPPYDVDAHDGDVIVGGSTFSAGYIYGDVTTNGGAATTGKASGVVDNNVPIVVPTATPGVAPIPLLPGPGSDPSAPSTITPTATPDPTTRVLKRSFWYTYSNLDGVTINPLKTAGGTPIDTEINIYVTGNVGDLTVKEGASVNVYFRGNLSAKARDIDNVNADGPVMPWTWFYKDLTARTSATGFVASDVGKVAYQDGNPGTYWKLTSIGSAGPPAVAPTWSSSAYIPSGNYVPAADAVCIPVASSQNPVKWTYATAAARTAATGFVAADVGKLAYQTDTQVYYTLSTTTPTWTAVPSYTASPLVSRAGHLWFYGISPADGSARSVTIDPPGTTYAAFYTPSHDFSINGNPDIFGVMVAKSYYANGNCTFHFDKQLATSNTPLDYRIANYVEDIR
jgi:hypothetical protein